MTEKFVIDLIVVSVAGWLAGFVVGGGIGYCIARLALVVFSAMPRLCKPTALLLPWRTAVMATILFVCYPALLRIQPESGPVPILVSVGLITFLLALIHITSLLLEHWHHAPLALRCVGGARTLATASVVFAIISGELGGGSVFFPMISAVLRRYNTFFVQYCVAVLVLILALDLLLGTAQCVTAMIIYRTLHQSGRTRLVSGE